MAKSALPLLLLGGAALVVMGKKKTGARPAVGSPAPPPTASKPTATKPSELLAPLAVEKMLNDLGYPPGAIDGTYDADTAAAVETFQMDWNSLMEWLWEHRDIAKTDPKYGLIGVDGIWGPETESRAVRAYDKFGPGGDAFIEVGGSTVPVENFRDSVRQAYEHTA
jgi:hypothetical protein